MKSEIIVAIILVIPIIIYVLSQSSFSGGWHAGIYSLLFKASKLNEIIVSKGSPEMLTAWNEYLLEISVNKNKPPHYFKWLSGEVLREAGKDRSSP